MICLAGPTAVGKSEVGLEMALRLGGEIVSADSMQIYRRMDLGTAKLARGERRGVPHHLIDSLDFGERGDVAWFVKAASEAIREIAARGHTPLVVGGTGLYLRALTRGLFEGPGRDDAIRARLEALPSEELWARLRNADPETAAKMAERPRRRMVRALEVFELTGRPISEAQTQWDAPATVPMFALARDREDLRRRCEARVARMFAQGWVDEVRRLAARGFAASPTASKAIGYAEILRFLSGNLPEKDLVTTVQRRTWQYARRQMTWLRKEKGLVWIPCAQDEPAARIAERILKKLA
ncbi:MAG: tRNA (adenosine(37)-N6)-dimethylallyltransferase MiaA [Verrucomicrobiae bacterium]|nr:tRNA (adenosine(37)-N6)-dimethylallyltransferase MiaA [Verrucomicrobiae bacterium]